MCVDKTSVRVRVRVTTHVNQMNMVWVKNWTLYPNSEDCIKRDQNLSP
jgi:hypothetical protein